jgi:hypothetical protein
MHCKITTLWPHNIYLDFGLMVMTNHWRNFEFRYVINAPTKSALKILYINCLRYVTARL